MTLPVSTPHNAGMPTRPSQPSPRPGNPEPKKREAFDEREDDEDEPRPSLEGILPELIRRGLEAGRGPLGRVSEQLFPRDMAANVVAQLGDIRSGVVKAVAQEVGRFLRDADIASEVRKVLIGLDVEANVRLRFKAREDGSLKPSLDVKIGEERRSNAPGSQNTQSPADTERDKR